MTSVGFRGADLPHKIIIKTLVPFHFKTMIHAHIYTHTYILRYIVCNMHEYIHAGILLNSFCIPRETQDFLINFLIDGTEIKDALFIAETFNSYFTDLGLTLAEKILIPLNRMMPLCLTLHLVHLVYYQPSSWK